MASRVIPLLDETLYLFDQNLRDNTLSFLVNTFLVAAGYRPLYIGDLPVDKEILSKAIQTFNTVEFTSANGMIYVHSPYLDPKRKLSATELGLLLNYLTPVDFRSPPPNLITLEFFINYKTAYRITLLSYKVRRDLPIDQILVQRDRMKLLLSPLDVSVEFDLLTN